MIAYSFYETDNRVMRYAETLAQRGDHVDVLALQRDGMPREETLNRVNLVRLQRRELNEKRRPFLSHANFAVLVSGHV